MGADPRLARDVNRLLIQECDSPPECVFLEQPDDDIDSFLELGENDFIAGLQQVDHDVPQGPDEPRIPVCRRETPDSRPSAPGKELLNEALLKSSTETPLNRLKCLLKCQCREGPVLGHADD
jgi:hypothetical protein